MKTMRIDLENHFYTEEFIRHITGLQTVPSYDPEKNSLALAPGLNVPADQLDALYNLDEKRIRDMDTYGIDRCVLSISQGIELLPVQESVEMASHANDFIASKVKLYPERFMASAILPVKDVRASVKELERCVKEYGFVAWHTHSNYITGYPDDEDFFPIFKMAADLGVYVYIHPTGPAEYGTGRYTRLPGLGFTVDTMSTLLYLIAGGIFEELPHLKVVCGHLGEGIPFIAQRMDCIIQRVLGKGCSLEKYLKQNLWVTTSGNWSIPAFNLTKEVMGMDRILAATDYPYEDMESAAKYFEQLPINSREREMLYHENFEKLIRK